MITPASINDIQITTLDLVIILACLLIITRIGILSAKHRKHICGVFFQAERSLNWSVIGATLFAAIISTILML